MNTQAGANYDRELTPSEVAARQEREGEDFKKTPEKEGDMDTTKGYTVDREGKMNNYAIEPEMYINEPGDLREEQEAEKARRQQELKDINSDGGKGPGVI
ncbi:MAG: hypothetical protein SWJ54_07080 [Cyanobacteriota bacterium]|nr:hypothetical protein [Cyanobacteriota bacterium]